MAMVNDDHTIFVGNKFLESTKWNPQVDLSTDPNPTVYEFIFVGSPEQLPQEYHQLAAIYQEHENIKHPSFQTILNSLPQAEQLKALRTSLNLSLHKTFQKDLDMRAGGILAHEVTHLRQNRESRGKAKFDNGLLSGYLPK